MFCTCPAFKRQVLTMDQTRVCKHVIGTRIAVALDDETVKSGFLESSEMAKIYCDMNHCTTRRPVLPDTPAPGPGHNDTNDTDLSTESLASDPDV